MLEFRGEFKKFESLSTSVQLSPNFFAEKSVFVRQPPGVENLQKMYFPILHVPLFGERRTIFVEIYEFLMRLEKKIPKKSDEIFINSDKYKTHM